MRARATCWHRATGKGRPYACVCRNTNTTSLCALFVERVVLTQNDATLASIRFLNPRSSLALSPFYQPPNTHARPPAIPTPTKSGALQHTSHTPLHTNSLFWFKKKYSSLTPTLVLLWGST